MKLILKDKQELIIDECYFKYFPNNSDGEPYNISLIMQQPTVNIDDLKSMLTKENLSEVKIVSKTKVVSKNNLHIINFIESMSDEINHINICIGE